MSTELAQGEQRLRDDGGTSSPRRRLAAILFVVSPFVAVWIWLTLAPGGSWVGAILAVSDDALDFGEVWEQEDFSWNLPISNPGPNDIHVLAFRGLCACTRTIPPSLVIPARGEAAVQVHFDLRPKGPKDSSREVHEFRTDIIPIIQEAVPGAVRWQVRGRVRPYPVVCSAAEVEFGESLVRGSPFPTQSIDVRCLRPVAQLAVDCDSKLLKVEALPRKAGDRYELKFSPSTALSLGEHCFDVKLKPELKDAAAGSDLPPMTVKVCAQVQNDIYLAPCVVCLGALALGQIGEESVMLGSRRGKPFTLVRVDNPPGNGLAVEPAAGAANASGRVFRVTQRVTKPGESQTAVQFVVRENDANEIYSVCLTVTWRGSSN